MEDKAKMFDTLLERLIDYSKTTIALAKLKTVDKTSDVLSTVLPHLLSLMILATALLFLNIGLALWLNEMLFSAYLGFIIIAGANIIVVLILHFAMHKWLKNKICNMIIKKLSN